MVSNCFVPGCSTGNGCYKTKHKDVGTKKPSLFAIPKDPVLREKWRILIARKDKVLTENHRVCELHFEENCIERYYVTIIKGGEINKIKRGRPLLKPDSIPTKNLPYKPKYLNMNYSEKLKRPANSQGQKKKVKKVKSKAKELKDVNIRSTSHEPNSDNEEHLTSKISASDHVKITVALLEPERVNEEQFISRISETDHVDMRPLSPQSENVNREQLVNKISESNYLRITTPSSQPLTANEEQTPQPESGDIEQLISMISESDHMNSRPSSSHTDNCEDRLVSDRSESEHMNIRTPSPQPNSDYDEQFDCSTISEPRHMTYAQLIQELEKIEMPGKYWTVSLAADCIVFLKLNTEFFCERHVVISQDCTVKIFVKNKEITFPDVDLSIVNPDTLSLLLQKVEKLILFEDLISKNPLDYGGSMAKIRKRKYTKKSPVHAENFQKAVAKILSGEMSSRKAAEVYNVSRNTLNRNLATFKKFLSEDLQAEFYPHC